MRDGRLRLAVLITLVLLLTAVLSGWRYQQQLAVERHAAEQVERERWLEQGQKNPHSAAHTGAYAFKPPSAFTSIEQGIDPFVGAMVWLEAHQMNQFLYRRAQDGTALTRFGELTAALTLQVLLPLLIILLTFGTFAIERERGTLRQLLSLGVSPRALTWGKLLGASVALAIVIVPAAALGGIAVMLHSSAAAGSNGARFSLLLLLYATYLAGWAMLTVAVSARASTGSSALAIMLGLWILGCLALPRVASDIAAWRHPVPSGATLQEALEHDVDLPGLSERSLQRRDRIMAAYNVKRPEELPVDWRGINLQEEEERNYPIFDRHYGALFDRYRAQDQVLQALGVVAPLLAVQSLSHAFAGTDFEHHRRFVFAAEAQRRVIQKIMNEDVALNDREGRNYRAGPEVWAKVPAFEYEAPALRDILPHYTVAILTIAAWFAGTAIATVVAVRFLRV